MITSTRHGADAVVASGKSSRNCGRQEAIPISGVIDAFEEDKLGSIKWLLGIEVRAHVLNSNVGMSNDFPPR